MPPAAMPPNSDLIRITSKATSQPLEESEAGLDVVQTQVRVGRGDIVGREHS
jgi:hypothetical protein